MRLGKALVLSSCLLLAACAGQKPAATGSSPDDYVEIDNPGYTMSADQPAKIWVPRRYVESGPPRGSEVVKKGVEKVFPSKSDQQPAPQQPARPQAPAGTFPRQQITPRCNSRPPAALSRRRQFPWRSSTGW